MNQFIVRWMKCKVFLEIIFKVFLLYGVMLQVERDLREGKGIEWTVNDDNNG
jgi:hypothetical protein